MPKFSVVIPVYNKEAFLQKTIESVLQQSFTDFEIIIINDGSTDRSADIIKQFKNERIKNFHQENQGVAHARHRGIQEATSDHIALLDADDLWLENHLSTLKESIDLFPKAALYATNYKIRYTKEVIRPTRFSNFDAQEKVTQIQNYFQVSLLDNLVWTSASCFKKETYFKIGGFNSLYKTGQDLDLWIRFALSHQIIFHSTASMIYNKGIHDSLSKHEYNDVRLKLYTSYLEEEKNNKDLNRYIDQKRYGLALRTKLRGDFKIYNEVKRHINFDHLNLKQKTLLRLPSQFLYQLNKLRDQALSNTLFLKLFK